MGWVRLYLPPPPTPTLTLPTQQTNTNTTKQVVELLGSSGLLEEALGELAHLRAQQQAAEDAEEEEGDDDERDARERGALVADHRIYFSLVRNALAHGLPDAAARALGVMAAMGCAPPPPAMKLLWDAVIKAGHPREGLSLLEALVASSSSSSSSSASSPAMPVMPPPTYHSTRLRLLLAAGDRAGAMAEVCVGVWLIYLWVVWCIHGQAVCTATPMMTDRTYLPISTNLHL